MSSTQKLWRRLALIVVPLVVLTVGCLYFNLLYLAVAIVCAILGVMQMFAYVLYREGAIEGTAPAALPFTTTLTLFFAVYSAVLQLLLLAK
ncbi:hypothetical protein KA078_03055 [Candidatus Woesebacteria bacterium]|nr:hypothetical protein [Candidatus Woesebacteria bacterium]